MARAAVAVYIYRKNPINFSTLFIVPRNNYFSPVFESNIRWSMAVTATRCNCFQSYRIQQLHKFRNTFVHTKYLSVVLNRHLQFFIVTLRIADVASPLAVGWVGYNLKISYNSSALFRL